MSPRASRRRSVTFDDVREIGLAMPGVEEGTTYGTPALKLHGKLLTCIPSHQSAEPNSLAVRVSFDDRDDLLREAPGTYYVKEHYQNYPVVLVRLPRIQLGELRDLLNMSYRFVASEKRRTRSSSR
jgi:hypothetical protein